MNRKLSIGLFGFGNVGQGFYELTTQAEHLNLEIKHIGVKNADKKESWIHPVLPQIQKR